MLDLEYFFKKTLTDHNRCQSMEVVSNDLAKGYIDEWFDEFSDFPQNKTASFEHCHLRIELMDIDMGIHSLL